VQLHIAFDASFVHVWKTERLSVSCKTKLSSAYKFQESRLERLRICVFRLEQNNIGSTFPLLEALCTCTKLRRILIWSCPNDQPLKLKPVLELFESCQELVMFYATIDKTTKKDCKSIRRTLEQSYSAQRPALSVIIRNSLEEDELIRYPSVHYRQMVVNEAHICQTTDFREFSRKE
jgi:hypothetical protein